MYDPTVGRFISEDWIGFEGGDTNLSRYVGNSPTVFVDPSGQQAAKPDYNDPNFPRRGQPQAKTADFAEGPAVTAEHGLRFVIIFVTNEKSLNGSVFKQIITGQKVYKDKSGNVLRTTTQLSFDLSPGNPLFLLDVHEGDLAANVAIVERTSP